MDPRVVRTRNGHMARFQDLSVDLLYVIFAHLQSDKQQLCDLSLTCRLFRDISQRFIVRNAFLSHSSSRSRPELFLRTLEERPDLTTHVHRLELDLLREDIHWPEEQANIHRITLLLFNLREFCYLSRDYKVWHYGVDFPLRQTRKNAHENVRLVEWHHNMSFGSLVQCMKLPRIESIYCRELHAPANELTVATVLPERCSSVKEIRMGSMLGLPMEPFQAVLRMPRCLRKLTLDIHEQFRVGLEPHEIPHLLKPVQDTLEELHIYKMNWLSPRPGSWTNLSTFISLRRVSIPFLFIFGSADPKRPLPNSILPPRLLEINFSFTSARKPGSHWNALDRRTAFSQWLKCIILDPITVTMVESDLRCYDEDLHDDAIPQLVRTWNSISANGQKGLVVRHQYESQA